MHSLVLCLLWLVPRSQAADPFADLEAAPVSSRVAEGTGFLGEGFGFRKELMLQYSESANSGVLAGRHSLGNLRGEPKWSLEVEVHHAVEQRFADLMRWLSRRHAGIVDQNVDATEFGIGKFDQAIDIRPATCMGGDGERSAAHGAHVGGGGFTGVQLAAGDNQVGAAGGEGLHHLQTKAAAAAGDQGHLAGQIELGIVGHGVTLSTDYIFAHRLARPPEQA